MKEVMLSFKISTKKGANPLLRLRLLKLNGEWDTYWQERRKEFIRHAA